MTALEMIETARHLIDPEDTCGTVQERLKVACEYLDEGINELKGGINSEDM